jgi:hypothetical protein
VRGSRRIHVLHPTQSRSSIMRHKRLLMNQKLKSVKKLKPPNRLPDLGLSI